MFTPASPHMSQGVEVLGGPLTDVEKVLTPGAMGFLAGLHRAFDARRRSLLEARVDRQRRLDHGEPFDFLKATEKVRQAEWSVAPMVAPLSDRRVEITGPVERKMIINALNSGANVFMADFEDANSPTWENNIQGQLNLMDAVRGTIAFTSGAGKAYRLNDRIATLMVRPRGWHLEERHLKVDGAFISGSLFDFGLYFFHNAQVTLERGQGPYFYLPKLESHLEARLWNDVFVHAQEALGVPQGSVRATVLIETLPAAFEMDEILYELRAHSAGLNCGRWDYIFSFIKKGQANAALLPDRGQISMDRGFLSAYSQLLIKTCHRRGAHAMGGMAAQIPIKDDPAANEAAMEKVRADKRREARDGHDGTWVAHPDLVPLAKAIFDQAMPEKNQVSRQRPDVVANAAALLAVPEGTRTEAGLRHNIRVGIQYIEAWLRGLGCVPLYNLMEDAATAEISRAQVWQWLHHGATLEGGTRVSSGLVTRATDEELRVIEREVGPERFRAGRFTEARTLFQRLCLSPRFEEFLTLPAYERLLVDTAS